MSPMDPCEEADGTLTAEGACYKECTWDNESPGKDLFEDCAPLQMVCDGLGYCLPGGVCDNDADCGPGRRCISYGGGECILDCAESGTCPSADFACVTTCPNNGENIDNLPGCLDVVQQNQCEGL